MGKVHVQGEDQYWGQDLCISKGQDQVECQSSKVEGVKRSETVSRQCQDQSQTEHEHHGESEGEVQCEGLMQGLGQGEGHVESQCQLISG